MYCLQPATLPYFYSELNLNQYSVGSPCRNVCTVCGSPPCPDLNLIHYILTPPTLKRRKLPCCIWLAWGGLSGSLGKAGGLPIVLCGGEAVGVGVVDAVALGNVGEVVVDGVAQGVAAFDVEFFAQLVKTFGGCLGE